MYVYVCVYLNVSHCVHVVSSSHYSYSIYEESYHITIFPRKCTQ